MTKRTRGFTLIASLLLLLLMSGLAVGLMMMVNTETRVGGNDLEDTIAYYGAEAGMEKMAVDLADLFGTTSPTAATIAALGNHPPDLPGLAFGPYTLTEQTDASGKPLTKVDTISSGPNQGLIAEIIPISLNVTATRPGGASVNMSRTVEVALIPVFQFGVFSEPDLSYFPGPDFDFKGRVHTNGNLFLTPGGSLFFHSKVEAVKEVVRDYLSNGTPANSSFGYTGPVYIPNSTNGCDTGKAPPNSSCLSFAQSQGSMTGGVPPSGNENKNWATISQTTFNYFVVNGKTGATSLTMPFVGGDAGPIEIVRKPPKDELTSSPVGQSRLFNKAQLRILLADTEAQLVQGTSAVTGDADNIQLDNEAGSYYAGGVNVTGVAGASYFAYANTDCSIVSGSSAGWCEPDDEAAPYNVSLKGTNKKQWPLLDSGLVDAAGRPQAAWLRVEYMDASGTWHGVTRQWLALGFARGLNPPAAPGANSVHLNAILILQQQADRDGDGTLTKPGTKLSSAYKDAANKTYDTTGQREAGPNAGVPAVISGANTKYIWYPINMYDPREGEIRDTQTGKTGTCAPAGILNAVEVDVGNLRRWLTGAISGSGGAVDYITQNGYLLYYSDRRGMLPNPNAQPVANVQTGEFGYEDTINAASTAGTPDGGMEPFNAGTKQSPEDVDSNGKLDDWGGANVGDGFTATAWSPIRNNPTKPDLYSGRVGCPTIARKNIVTGARHVLKLVDGGLGNLPTRPDGSGGFTVASENPVYIQGNYNANASGFGTGNAAAAVIADAVTLLSNNWSDLNGFKNAVTPASRAATTTWYRVAIAAGKNISFPKPGWASSSQKDYGTDGGLHNFLRYIEDWGSATLNYQGSLVSLYYSQYSTGVFKCCTTVYGPPYRAYSFDSNFLDPRQLPPGTPAFRDINSLSYHQDFAAR